ncbi:MAG: type II/IV secretion system protein, partial [Candidatus Eisenbacteria sp.]|nr:type II/IV secretion system protein [Candidatus Eisenbacteria bacterium]
MVLAMVGPDRFKKFQENMDLDFSTTLDDGNRFRVNAHYQRDTIAISFRVIPNEIPLIDDLHLPPIVKELTDLPRGLVLVTGHTGSGKSTTLYAGMGELDRIGRNITTLEDPVEYHLDRVNQVNVNRKAGMTFSSGLRSILRQDPDIIMVGEIRDMETAELAIRSALTGHLVLSTVHANDAPATATRLVDIGIEPFLVTSAVHLVMAQRLVRRICPHCKEPYEPDVKAVTALIGEGHDGATFYKGKGCKHCKGRGFLGRTAIFEMLDMTPEISELVMKGSSADALRRKAIDAGFVTLRENAAKKVLDGITTVEEALSVSTEMI